jgi:hypothetical protein
LDSTVLSDAVNIASRLESLTKYFGSPIIISSSLRDTIPQPLSDQKFLGTIRVKGRTQGLAVYEDFSSLQDQETKSQREKILDDFVIFQDQLKSGKYDLAQHTANEIILNPQCIPSWRVVISDLLKKHNTECPWDGVLIMEEK